MRTLTFLLVVLLVHAACRSESTPPPAPTPVRSEKDPAEAKRLIASGATVIDVRSSAEYADGHLPTATNIPVDTVADRLADVAQLVGGDKTKPVVVYCAKGGRAAKAKATLEGAGFTHVVNGGGLDDLQ